MTQRHVRCISPPGHANKPLGLGGGGDLLLRIGHEVMGSYHGYPVLVFAMWMCGRPRDVAKYTYVHTYIHRYLAACLHTVCPTVNRGSKLLHPFI